MPSASTANALQLQLLLRQQTPAINQAAQNARNAAQPLSEKQRAALHLTQPGYSSTHGETATASALLLLDAARSSPARLLRSATTLDASVSDSSLFSGLQDGPSPACAATVQGLNGDGHADRGAHVEGEATNDGAANAGRSNESRAPRANTAASDGYCMT